MPKDVVGVELFGDDSRGCPAVRLVRHRDGISVRAFGFVPPPSDPLPVSWDELKNQPTWSLPLPFAAPSAAFAVNSPGMVVQQRQSESFTEGALKKLVTGVPVSAEGRRTVIEPMAEKGCFLETVLPEYQVLWLSRLLPEGKHPTVCSIQNLPTAFLASLSELSSFNADDGNAAALFVSAKGMHFAGFRGGGLVLFRELANVGGLRRIRLALKSGFGMELKMVDDILDDSVIDATPILGTIVNPVLRQLELSLNFLENRIGVTVKHVHLMGLPSGVGYWNLMCERTLGVKLMAPSLFDGLELPPKMDQEMQNLLKRSQLFLGAYGAARAAMEVDA